MAIERTIIPAVTVPTTGTVIMKRWPSDAPSMKLVLEDAAFLAGAVSVSVEADFGRGFQLISQDIFDAGAKDESGNPPSMTLGPYKRGDANVPPTAIRVTLNRSRGAPVVGLRSNVDD